MNGVGFQVNQKLDSFMEIPVSQLLTTQIGLLYPRLQFVDSVELLA